MRVFSENTPISMCHAPTSTNCLNRQTMPFSFTNLSMHSQYLGKDKVVGFAESTTDEVEVHELADYDEIKEMM